MRPSSQRKFLCFTGIILICSSYFAISSSYSVPSVPQPVSIADRPQIDTFQLDNNSHRIRNKMVQPSVGSIRTFWTLNHSSLEHYQVDAELLAIGNHCYIYMEDVAIDFLGESVAIARCESYRDEFDSTIYPSVVDLAGQPDGTLGDIDGDSRIIILLSTNPVNYYGYENEFEQSIEPYSNLCEMVYIRYTTSYILGVISHEFHHLILFNHDGNEVPFVYESLAQFAAKYTGAIIPWDNITWGVSDFLLHSEDSLIYWTPNTGGAEAEVDYGSAYLFGLYLAEQFGIEFMRELVIEDSDGAEGIMNTLNNMGFNISFNDLYLNWITALTIDQPSIADGQYGFHDANATMHSVGIVSELPYEYNDLPLRCYGFNIRRLVTPPDYFVVDITYLPTYNIGVSIAYHDNDGWHIQQKTQSGGSLVEIVEGSSIDNAYIMTSYLYENTPSGTIVTGYGVSTHINLAILEELPEPTVDWGLLPFVIIVGAIMVTGVALIVWKFRED